MLDSGIMLYDWMENNVSQSDGSWINDFSNPWKGTNVFGAISLGEGIKNCGGILESKDLKRMRERLRKAANFIDSFIKFGKSDVKFAGPNITWRQPRTRLLYPEKYWTNSNSQSAQNISAKAL